MSPLEEEIRLQWPHLKGRHGHKVNAGKEKASIGVEAGAKNTLLKRARTAISVSFKTQTVKQKTEVMSTSVRRQSWLGTVVHNVTSSF